MRVQSDQVEEPNPDPHTGSGTRLETNVLRISRRPWERIRAWRYWSEWHLSRNSRRRFNDDGNRLRLQGNFSAAAETMLASTIKHAPSLLALECASLHPFPFPTPRQHTHRHACARYYAMCASLTMCHIVPVQRRRPGCKSTCDATSSKRAFQLTAVGVRRWLVQVSCTAPIRVHSRRAVSPLPARCIHN